MVKTSTQTLETQTCTFWPLVCVCLILVIGALVVWIVLLKRNERFAHKLPMEDVVERMFDVFRQDQPFEKMPHSPLADIVYRGRALSHPIKEEWIEWKRSCPYPVILSLTTSPMRIAYIRPLLQIIHPGSYDSIQLNIPRTFARDSTKYRIPADLASFPRLEIHTIDQDIGPATKLIPTLERLKQKAIVITLDDDVAYDCDLVFSLLRAQHQTQYQAAIGLSGLVREESLSFRSSKRSFAQAQQLVEKEASLAPVDILEGLGMVSYPSWLVNHAFVKKAAMECKACFTSDDFVISFTLDMLHVPRLELAYKRGILPFLSYGLMGDALHKQQSHFDKYEECYQFIVQQASLKEESE